MVNFFFQAEDGIRDYKVTGVQTCALPISAALGGGRSGRRALPRGGAGGRPPDQGAAAEEDLRRDLPGRTAPGPSGDELHARDPAAAGLDHRPGHGFEWAVAPA